MNKISVGLYFGSFNPVHNGHLMIANYLVEYTSIDELWFVVSPQNPHKDKKVLLDGYHRIELLERAIGNDPRFRICDIEFTMPRPSYTIDTLVRLSERYPNCDFTLICGMDNLVNFRKWKNYQMILENYKVMVYPRKGFDGGDLLTHPSVSVADAPEIEISSSFIRAARGSGKDVRYFMNGESYKFMTDMHFYEEK